MIVDGKAIADDILSEVKHELGSFPRTLRLGLLFVTPDFATTRFIAIKEKRAAELGVEIVKRELHEGVTTEEAIAAAKQLADETDGVIVQLPLAESIDAETLIEAVPPAKDVDGIGEGKLMLSPVIAAIREVLLRHDVSLTDKHVTIVGKGRLVGAPAAQWLYDEGIHTTVVSEGDDVAHATKHADIIILGTGKSGLLTPDMIKEGVVVIDAGTSEAAGKLAGDADPSVAEKASLLTPVPGGIGPIAVAMIFKNLVALARAHM